MGIQTSALLDSKEVVKSIKKLTKYSPKAVVDVINSAALKIISGAKKDLTSKYGAPVVNTGILRASLDFGQPFSMSEKASIVGNVESSGGSSGPLFATVGTSLPYAEAIEYGTGPHHVPPDDLIEWAMEKFSVDETEAMTIAFGTALGISKHGTPAKPFLMPNFDKQKKKLPKMIKKKLKKVIKKYWGK